MKPTVVVTRAAEPIDIDAWLRDYASVLRAAVDHEDVVAPPPAPPARSA